MKANFAWCQPPLIAHVASLLVGAAGLLLAACASIPGPFPELNESALVDVVAVVRFRRGAYLQQFPGCDRPDVICMDPPPFELRAEVVEQPSEWAKTPGAIL